MVCEAIDVATRKEKYKPTDIHSNRDGRFVMYRRVLPMSVLTTCRLVNQEAEPIIVRKLQAMVKEPVRFRMDCTATQATQDTLYHCFNSVHEPVLLGTKDYHSRLRFIKNCSSYLIAISHACPIDTVVADAEVTITDTLDIRRDSNRVSDKLYGICTSFGVSIDMLSKEHPTISSRIHTTWSAPSRTVTLSNWKMKAGRSSGVSELRFRDMDGDEWAEHMQMLEEL